MKMEKNGIGSGKMEEVVIQMRKYEKIAGFIKKAEEEMDKVFWSDYEEKYKIYCTFFELVKDVIEGRIQMNNLIVW